MDQLLRLTRNTDDCKSVKFDFNHEHLKIEAPPRQISSRSRHIFKSVEP